MARFSANAGTAPNTDRHYGNIGFLVDSRRNQITAPAPLFDHGNSLLNFASSEALTSEKAILKYAAAQKPCVYDDFIEEARPLLTHVHRNHLRKLLEFRFQRHRLYNLPGERLTLLETVVHE